MKPMKLYNVPLADIAHNPWRNTTLFPIDPEHIADLEQSMRDHGFIAGIKGRRVDGKVEIGFGHARIEAIKKAAKRLDMSTVPIWIADMDDDEMLRLMADENATQSGSNPAAVMNEVAAVTRRLLEGIMSDGEVSPPEVIKAFEDRQALLRARGRIRRSADVHIVLGRRVIRRYLGQGDEEKSQRSDDQIKQAIRNLKTDDIYDNIVDAALGQYLPPSDSKAVFTPRKRPKRTFDARCVHLFPNDHQLEAFRDAVTTEAGQRFIPVSEQYALAQRIMDPKRREGFKKKQLGAPYIKREVMNVIEDALKAQRKIDKEEEARQMAADREQEIDAILYTAKASLRSLSSSLTKLRLLARKHPGHPKIGGFSAKLDQLVQTIKQLSEALKRWEAWHAIGFDNRRG